MVEDIPFHRNLVKHDTEDIGEVFVRAKKYIRLEGIQKKKPSTSVATISAVTVKVQEPRLDDVSRPKHNKKVGSKYTF